MDSLKRTLPPIVLLVLALAVTFVTAAAPGTSPRTMDDEFYSTGVAGTLRYEVYLPDGYADTTTRYPVVYVLHGLPSGVDAYRSLGYVEHALDAAGKPAIFVAPQGARAGESDPEYLDQGPGKRWESALSGELVRVIDSRYRTIRSRSGRALIGLSAGGYGAMHLGLRHLDTYSVIESWSGYFHPTDPTGTVALDLGSDTANAKADVHRQLASTRTRLAALEPFIAFYVGKEDTRFAAENELLNQELSRAKVPHVFRIYSGGHTQALWQRNAATWLGLALSHLAPASG